VIDVAAAEKELAQQLEYAMTYMNLCSNCMGMYTETKDTRSAG
jgi:hypothetical protein